MELDHLFIIVNADGNDEAHLLRDAGFAEGTSNLHPGQGTANRRFFFRNAFIELLYVNNEAEIHNELNHAITLDRRLAGSGPETSPFGVCFRPELADGSVECFSPAKKIHPDYFPPAWHILVGEAPLNEPMWFYLDFATRPDRAPAEKAQPLIHPLGIQTLTRVRIGTPLCMSLSRCAEQAMMGGQVELFMADEHLVELEFDDGKQSKHLDFRPKLPMKIHY